MSVKILIVSDSHGNNRNLIQAVKKHEGHYGYDDSSG